jgi:hypothetical protein
MTLDRRRVLDLITRPASEVRQLLLESRPLLS